MKISMFLFCKVNLSDILYYTTNIEVTSYLIEVTIHTKAEHKNQMQNHSAIIWCLDKEKETENNTTPKISGRPVVRSFQEVD
jgi:hypothetical protein